MTGDFDVPIFKTIAESADITGLSKYQIRQFVLNKKIKFIKSGKKFLVNMTNLIEFLNNGETEEQELLKQER